MIAFLWITCIQTCQLEVAQRGVCGYIEAYQSQIEAEIRIGGDFDCDYDVDLLDYGRLQQVFGRCPHDPDNARWDQIGDYIFFYKNAGCFGGTV